MSKLRPGQVRDAILDFFDSREGDASIGQLHQAINLKLDQPVPASSIRSYLRLNTPGLFLRTSPGRYQSGLAEMPGSPAESTQASPAFTYGQAQYYQCDCLDWLSRRPECSIHAIVTDPPYSLLEYTPQEQAKLRNGRGGVWRIPPSFDGHKRSPLPRFTVLTRADQETLVLFFAKWARAIMPVLVPGGHVLVATNPLLSYLVSWALADAGLERRGEIARLVMTMRGGDRPKNAHTEFPQVSVMPRSMWEPWLVFRKPLEGRVQDNLRKWKTGGLRRISAERPFGDVIKSSPTRKAERILAPHPSLKPQAFLRQIVRAVLPMREGVVLDPFAGSGSTLAAAEAVGYASIGLEIDPHFVAMAESAVPALARLHVKTDSPDTPNLPGAF